MAEHMYVGTADIINGTEDPTVTSVPADIGSLFLNTNTGQVFKKVGSGGTDWVELDAGGGEFRLAFTNANLVSGILTVTHNLGQRYNAVTVYDNTNLQIIPDDISAVSTTSFTVDLSSFGAIAGTWNVVVGG